MNYYEPSQTPSQSWAPSAAGTQLESVLMDCIHMLAASVELDTATDSFLETLGCFYDAHTAFVLEYVSQNTAVTRTFFWHSAPQTSAPPSETSLPEDLFQPWTELLDAEGTICLGENDPRLELAAPFCGIAPKTMMAAPLYVGLELIGFLCVIDPVSYFGDMTVLLAIASLTVAELRKLRLTKELDYLRYKDPLTDVYNRFSYAGLLEKSYQDHPDSMGVMIVSMNGLKKVNSVLGDKFGDAAVQRTAEIMRRSLPADVYRIGGDEFLSLLPEVSSAEFQQLTKTLQDAFAGDSSCDVSIGTAWSGENVDIDALLVLANQELSANKVATNAAR